MKRKTKIKLAAVALFLAVTLLISEFCLRVWMKEKGYQIGRLAPFWETLSDYDSLVVKHEYFTDSLGIYRAVPAYWNQPGTQTPVNDQGFRGRPFERDSSESHHVFLIGDSYTWGSHASPLDSSFADLIEQNPGWGVFNGGIPGTDPAQYAKMAEEYVPKLKPEFTAVLFFMANDLMAMRRPVVPNKDLFFLTQKGWFPAWYKGEYFDSLEEAVQFQKKRYELHGSFEKLFVKTALGTFLLGLPFRMEEQRDWELKKLGEIPNQYLHEIKKTCKENGSEFMVFVIPSPYSDLEANMYERKEKYFFQKYPGLFTGLEGNTFVLPVVNKHYLPLPDGHFNNEGHKATSRFIISILESFL